jgi:hypothetical protein
VVAAASLARRSSPPVIQRLRRHYPVVRRFLRPVLRGSISVFLTIGFITLWGWWFRIIGEYALSPICIHRALFGYSFWA